MQKNLLLVLLTCLIGLSLSGCGGVKPFPTQDFYELNQKLQLCRKYKMSVVDNEVSFTHVLDKPLSQCPQITFGFDAKDVAPVMDWIEDTVTKAKQKCKK